MDDPRLTRHQRVVAGAFEVARKLFKGTPVQRWAVTDRLYRGYVAYSSRRLPGGAGSVIVRFRDLDIEIERGDITILPTLINGRYEAEEIEALVPRLRPGGTFVDVGANVGVYTLLAARALGENGRVVTVEPNEDTRRYLEANLSRNGVERQVVVEPVALADVDATLPWTTTRYHGTGRLAAGDSSGATVAVRRLDALVDEHGLDLRGGGVKIDVEGFEPRVIAGAGRVIRRDRPTLLVEVCGESSEAVSVDWAAAVDVLGTTYESIEVFGPAAQSVRGVRVRDAVAAVVADGRQHNVLLA
jgi:FkbM family methyltransferase